MKKTVLMIVSACSLLLGACTQQQAEKPRYRMWYTKQANRFEEMLPLGNGRLGMMPDGGVAKELVVLNDITMWSGCVTDNNNPEALKYLPKIRELLKQGKNAEAQELTYQTFVCSDDGSNNPKYGSYQILGNLHLEYEYADNADADAVSQYVRDLVLDDAVAHTEYQLNDVHYTREYMTLFGDDVMAIRLTADRKGALNFKALIDRPERFAVSCDNEKQELAMSGELDSGVEGVEGMKYMTRMRIVTDGEKSLDGKSIAVSKASQAVIYISTATNFRGVDEKAMSDELLDKALAGNYAEQKKAHIKAYRTLFDRADVGFGETKNDTIPTDRRLVAFYQDNKKDVDFAALYFQYGRYLLISSTRVGLLPPNLQGLWANTIKTPWNGDYHMNINVQMNHWPCETTNLSELHEPFIDQTCSLVEPGRVTAKVFYDADGWVCHMMTNVWGFTAPGEHPSWGATNTCGAWNCEHLWEHYAYSMDKEYLKKVYPVLKGATEFFLSMLIEEPKHGWLVTAPSSSPENAYILNGKALSVCMGPTMDTQIIRELFSNTVAAAQALGIDEGFCRKIEQTESKLPPCQIGKYGQLMEWLEDYEEAEIHHRHVSHLYGLFPSNQITPSTTPELAAAARETLKRRGDGGTGWSRAWKINFWARLGDGNHAYKMLTELLAPVAISGFDYSNAGGTYANLFDAHPPFQIDGNFGGCSGITEMLLQSHAGFIDYLPALPDALRTGFFKGFRVRGGAETDAQWKDGMIQQIELRATVDNTFKLRLPQGLPLDSYVVSGGNVADKKTLLSLADENGLVIVSLKKGEKVMIKVKH